MNGCFLLAGALLLVAFVVHSLAGNRTYSAARPDRSASRAYDAWLMGRCGMQMIGVDLLLAAGFLLAAGGGLIPRCRPLEWFVALIFCGWMAGWLLSLAVERAAGRHYRRLWQWVLFAVVALLVAIGAFR